MAREMRRYSLLELLGFAALVAALAVVLYRGWAQEQELQMPLAAPIDAEARRTRFVQIYDSGEWAKDAAGRGTSGSGSTLEATKLYRVFLQDFLAAHKIRSVVDAGCGDWEFSQAINWSGIDYLGLDIVPAVIEANRRRFGAAGVRFAVADIVRDELPKADLLIIKDVLQHLSRTDISAVLAQLARYRNVLIVNDVLPKSLTAEFVEIATGAYRPLDVTQPPFSLPGTKVMAWRHGDKIKLVVHLTPK